MIRWYGISIKSLSLFNGNYFKREQKWKSHLLKECFFENALNHATDVQQRLETGNDVDQEENVPNQAAELICVIHRHCFT